MPDPRIDAYIAASADFAKPILSHLRKLIHKAHPAIEENWKWGFPHFDYKGILCSMAAFKNHCSFGFWKASLMKDEHGLLDLAENHSMGSFGKLTSLKDLPSDKILIDYIKQAVQLNEEGVKAPVKAKSKAAVKKELNIPEELLSALTKNKKARSTFEAFSASQKKEYVEWITEAKTAATKEKRLTTAIEWMAEGKTRNWKYQSK